MKIEFTEAEVKGMKYKRRITANEGNNHFKFKQVKSNTQK